MWVRLDKPAFFVRSPPTWLLNHPVRKTLPMEPLFAGWMIIFSCNNVLKGQRDSVVGIEKRRVHLLMKR